MFVEKVLLELIVKEDALMIGKKLDLFLSLVLFPVHFIMNAK